MVIVTGIVGKVAEYAIEPAIRRVGYLTHCRSSLQNLRTQVDKLTSAREGVEHKVDEAQRQGKRIESEVQNWLKQVDEITEEAGELWKDEIQAKMNCLHGFCPNLILRYQLSRKSKKLEQDAVKLYENRGFTNFSYDVRPQEVCTVSTKYYEAFDSRISTLEKIMDELRSPSTDLIVVYGIGGVGKTTLVEEVLRQAIAKKLFTDAVMVRDVKNPDLQRIQKEIAEKLGMKVGENETMAGRAPHLCSRIKDGKVLVILDDIWEKVDLETLGLPCLSNCKILLTSRNLKFLSSEMRPQKELQLEVLNEKETWSLFEKKAGDVVKDHAIRNIAIQVSEKCGGLPVLVVTVASALKKRSNLYAWNDALRCLKAFDGEELTEEAYSALEWSFNQLDSKLKPLFLLCGSIIGLSSYNSAHFSDLFKYAMGLGLFKNYSLEQASNALHSWIEQLKDSCLLLDNVGDEYIRMHDVVHNAAIAIASKDQRALFRKSGGDLKEWPNNRDFFEKCTTISLAHCNVPRLPEVFECQELEMFILGCKGGDPVEIPDTFFKGMIKLKVLDLTKLDIGSLPSSLQLLENLRTLCLDGCVLGDIALVGQRTSLEILSFLCSDLEELPKEIGKLTHLRLLDLTGCYQLKVISPNVLSSLKSLEDLRMRNSFHQWVAEGVSGERSNASLLELKDLPHLAALAVHIPDASIMPRGLFSDKLKRYDISIGDTDYTVSLTFSFQRTTRYGIWDSMDGTLNTLKLKLTTRQELDDGLKMLLKRSEALYLHGLENDFQFQSDSEDFQQLKHLYVQNIAKFTYLINEKVGLPNLTRLIVHECGSRFLFSSSTARTLVQLKYLEVKRCHMMEEIVSTQEYGEENADGMFCKLQHLKLIDLQILSRFCSGNYIEFPSLESLAIVDCNVLETFICEPKSKSITVRRETKEDLKKTVVQYFLFDDKCVLQVGLPNLTRLIVHECGSRFLFSSSTARTLVQLKYLEVKRCHMMEEIVSTQEYGEEKADGMFCKLQHLKLIDLQILSRFCSGNYIEFPSLESLEIVDCNVLETFICEPKSKSITVRRETKEDLKKTVVQYFPFDDKVGLPSLTRLIVHEYGSRFLFSSSTARSLVQLKYLEVSGCHMMEEIVSTQEYGEENADGMFCKLQHLKLQYLQILSRFCSGNYIEFPSLESLEIVNCNVLETFICKPKSKSITVRRETKEDLKKTVVQYFLFDDKVGFPRLEGLFIRGLNKLTAIWHNQHVPGSLCRGDYTEDKHEASAQNLVKAVIRECSNLQYILYCPGIEEISAKVEGVETTPEFVFPKVVYFKLEELPQLKSFYPGIHASKWPLLEELKVRRCDKLDILSVELSSFQKHVLGGVSAPIKQSLFVIEKDSFPKLDKLVLDGTMEICGDLLPAGVFRKLKSVEFYAPYSAVETSHEQGRSAEITLEGVSAWKYQGSGGLRHLWKENSRPACPVFPSLEILRVLGCIRIQDLVTSAISFQNLTTLEVVGCHRLKSLTNYSVAKTLMQLREMTLVNCKRMIKIVETSDGEDVAGNEIAFSRLLHLKLSILPSLKDFCSGNCIVKFPQLKTFFVRNCPELKISSELERIPLQEQFDGNFNYVYSDIVDGDDDDDVEMVPKNSI
ncbi:probable disease resistance protein At4g27220 isoform X4 [Pyrus communis]|uniref:probable disease resistance protein At4g27220 isoform X4 n=1 Tax=Pyrus communis TaxID=23211 RepID=UPI0035BFA312